MPVAVRPPTPRARESTVTSMRIEGDTKDAAAHVGGISPGVGRTEGTPAAPRAGAFGSLARKAASIAAGMLGLALIGLVAEVPKSQRAELLSLAPEVGQQWLAGSEPTQVPTASSEAASGDPPKAPAPSESSTTPSGPSSPPSASAAPSAAPSAVPPAGPAAGITADGKVILNRASAAELTQLPGIGQKRAEKILELRQKLGRFKKPADLLRVKGIGPKGLQKMLPHLVLDPPVP